MRRTASKSTVSSSSSSSSSSSKLPNNQYGSELKHDIGYNSSNLQSRAVTFSDTNNLKNEVTFNNSSMFHLNESGETSKLSDEIAFQAMSIVNYHKTNKNSGYIGGSFSNRKIIMCNKLLKAQQSSVQILKLCKSLSIESKRAIVTNETIILVLNALSSSLQAQDNFCIFILCLTLIKFFENENNGSFQLRFNLPSDLFRGLILMSHNGSQYLTPPNSSDVNYQNDISSKSNIVESQSQSQNISGSESPTTSDIARGEPSAYEASQNIHKKRKFRNRVDVIESSINMTTISEPSSSMNIDCNSTIKNIHSKRKFVNRRIDSSSQDNDLVGDVNDLNHSGDLPRSQKSGGINIGIESGGEHSLGLVILDIIENDLVLMLSLFSSRYIGELIKHLDSSLFPNISNHLSSSSPNCKDTKAGEISLESDEDIVKYLAIKIVKTFTYRFLYEVTAIISSNVFDNTTKNETNLNRGYYEMFLELQSSAVDTNNTHVCKKNLLTVIIEDICLNIKNISATIRNFNENYWDYNCILDLWQSLVVLESLTYRNNRIQSFLLDAIIGDLQFIEVIFEFITMIIDFYCVHSDIDISIMRSFFPEKNSGSQEYKSSKIMNIRKWIKLFDFITSGRKINRRSEILNSCEASMKKDIEKVNRLVFSSSSGSNSNLSGNSSNSNTSDSSSSSMFNEDKCEAKAGATVIVGCDNLSHIDIEEGQENDESDSGFISTPSSKRAKVYTRTSMNNTTFDSSQSTNIKSNTNESIDPSHDGIWKNKNVQISLSDILLALLRVCVNVSNYKSENSKPKSFEEILNSSIFFKNWKFLVEILLLFSTCKWQSTEVTNEEALGKHLHSEKTYNIFKNLRSCSVDCQVCLLVLLTNVYCYAKSNCSEISTSKPNISPTFTVGLDMSTVQNQLTEEDSLNTFLNQSYFPLSPHYSFLEPYLRSSMILSRTRSGGGIVGLLSDLLMNEVETFLEDIEVSDTAFDISSKEPEKTENRCNNQEEKNGTEEFENDLNNMHDKSTRDQEIKNNGGNKAVNETNSIPSDFMGKPDGVSMESTEFEKSSELKSNRTRNVISFKEGNIPIGDIVCAAHICLFIDAIALSGSIICDINDEIGSSDMSSSSTAKKYLSLCDKPSSTTSFNNNAISINKRAIIDQFRRELPRHSWWLPIRVLKAFLVLQQSMDALTLELVTPVLRALLNMETFDNQELMAIAGDDDEHKNNSLDKGTDNRSRLKYSSSDFIADLFVRKGSSGGERTWGQVGLRPSRASTGINKNIGVVEGSGSSERIDILSPPQKDTFPVNSGIYEKKRRFKTFS